MYFDFHRKNVTILQKKFRLFSLEPYYNPRKVFLVSKFSKLF